MQITDLWHPDWEIPRPVCQ